jgi:hypothetical protein
VVFERAKLKLFFPLWRKGGAHSDAARTHEALSIAMSTVITGAGGVLMPKVRVVSPAIAGVRAFTLAQSDLQRCALSMGKLKGTRRGAE